MVLVGRELERKRLAELVNGVRHRGGALVLRGEAGVGKSELLAEAGRLASASSVRTLSTVGVESEERLPYAGLHQLLYPVRAGIEALPAPQRAALGAALGLTDQAVPDVHLVGLATLTLLTETGTDPAAGAARRRHALAGPAHHRRARVPRAPPGRRAHRAARDRQGR